MMKDKLEKTGRTKRYYQFRYFCFALLFSLGAFCASAIPVGISIQLAEAEAQAAVQRSSEEETQHVETSTSEGDEASLPLEEATESV